MIDESVRLFFTQFDKTVVAGRKAEIAVDQIRTLSKERLGRKLDEIEPPAAASVRRLITQMYGE